MAKEIGHDRRNDGDDAGRSVRDFPKTTLAFEAPFKAENDTRRYWIKARWGGKPACDLRDLDAAGTNE